MLKETWNACGMKIPSIKNPRKALVGKLPPSLQLPQLLLLLLLLILLESVTVADGLVIVAQPMRIAL